MRRGFTLIELLIIVAIVGALLTMAVGNLTAGLGAAEMSTGGRSVMQLARHARTMALLNQRPCVITYTDGGDGEGAASRIKLELQAETGANNVQTVKSVYAAGDAEDGQDGEDAGEKGELASMMEHMEHEFKGIRLKVELLEIDGKTANEGKSAISIFSNLDYVLGDTRKERKEREKKRNKDRDGEDGGDEKEATGAEEPVAVTYEPNGRVQAHRVTLYRAGADPDKDGVTITVDMFGKPRVEDE